MRGFSGGARMSSLLAWVECAHRGIARDGGTTLAWPVRGASHSRAHVPRPRNPQNPYDGHVAERGAEWLESVPDALAVGQATIAARPKRSRGPAGAVVDAALEGCSGGTEVRLVRMEEHAHTWAREQVDATAAMWEFFRRRTR